MWQVASHGTYTPTARRVCGRNRNKSKLWSISIRASGLGYGPRPKLKWQNDHKEVNNWSFDIFEIVDWFKSMWCIQNHWDTICILNNVTLWNQYWDGPTKYADAFYVDYCTNSAVYGEYDEPIEYCACNCGLIAVASWRIMGKNEQRTERTMCSGKMAPNAAFTRQLP